MWIVAAVFSAFFAGITAILSKCGIKNVNSDVATAIRTSVVLVFAWAIVFVTGAYETLSEIDPRSLIFLVLSGIATGTSWICYFKALSLGEVSKVAAVDKSSVIFSVLIAIAVFPAERRLWWVKLICLAAVGAGTWLMTEIKRSEEKTKTTWFFFALLSAIFAAITSVLSKLGMENVNSDCATAIRTGIVLIMAWLIVFAKKETGLVKEVNKKDLLFLVLSGISTGISWLCYFYAIQHGQISVVVPIDKLSIVITVVFSVIFLKEKASSKVWLGLGLLTAGTLCMAIFT
ncbi:MAG: EamA family transporter [Clostridiales bacterium]|nr:EamA family transporter [Clostridiales bacterium]MDY5726943.1 EamA family transporter [Eubacteriales bacterium]